MKASDNKNTVFTENDRVRQLIVRVGDDGPAYYKRDIPKLTSNLLDYYQKGDSVAKEYMIKTLIDCIGLLKHKASSYATVVALINVQNSNLSELLIDKAIERLQSGLDQGDLTIPRSVLIFLGDLMNIGLFNSFVYINLLFDLFNEAEKSLETSFDYYLHIGISVIPYVMESLKEKSGLEFNGLLQNIEKIMSRREIKYLNAIQVKKGGKNLDRLSMLWQAINEYLSQDKKTTIKSIVQPYKEFIDELRNIKQVKKNIKINFNSKNLKQCTYQSPAHFSIYDSQVLSSEISSILDQAILRENTIDVLIIFQHRKELIIQNLIKLNESFQIDHLIIETIFGEMFKLPNPECKLIFYSSTLIGLITQSPIDKREDIKKNVLELYAKIFDDCNKFDIEILDRYVDSFSHFMSNFEFSWDWASWKYVSTPDSPIEKCNQLKSILAKMINISYFEKVEEILPEELKIFLPPKDCIHFEYEDSSVGNQSDVEIIKDKLNSKLSSEEMINFLKSEDNNLEASGELLVDIFLQCLFNRCCKTLTHFHAHLDKYRDTLALLISKDNDHLVALETIKKFWLGSNFHISLYIDNFESRKLISQKNIINWLFKEIEKEEDITNNFKLYWDLLFSVINKALSRSEIIKSELNKLKLKGEKDEVSKLEKKLEASTEEEQNLFSIIFKKLFSLVSEVYNKNSSYKNHIAERMIQVTRKYRKDIESLYPKIEEDFSKIGNNAFQQILADLRELK